MFGFLGERVLDAVFAIRNAQGSRRRRSQAAVVLVLGVLAGVLVCAPFVTGIAPAAGVASLLALTGLLLGRAGLPTAAGLSVAAGAVSLAWIGVAFPSVRSSSAFELSWLFVGLAAAAGTLRPATMAAAAFVNLTVFSGLLYVNPGIPTEALVEVGALLTLMSVIGVGHAWQRTRTCELVDVRDAARDAALEQSRLRAAEAEAAREELAAAQAELLRASKLAALGELSATLAHEVNNPLTTVGLNAEELGDRHTDPDSREAMDAIQDAVRRCRSVVERLLAFARAGNAGIARTDLSEVTERTLRLVRRHLELRGARVEAEVQGPLWVEGDADALEQVVLNLLMNAGEALEGKGRIRIVSGRGPDEVWVAVEDTGRGIRPDVRERIFEPFFTTRAEEGGTGLGLAVCQRIAAGHAGAIDVEDAPGGGTRFRLRLPAGS